MQIEDTGLLFPIRIATEGGLEVVSIAQSVRVMLEQVLFTVPGERVNRPRFGVGIQQYVFEPLSVAVEDRLRVALQDNVYEYLGKRVRIESLTVERNDEEAQLIVRVDYVIEGVVAGVETLEVKVQTGGVV